MKNTHQRWFKEGKYGLFIHFGLYSLLGGIYQGKQTSGLAEWIMNDLDIPVKEYEKLAGMFDPTSFDAAQIAKKAHEWGMKYLCVTAKHHDGFALFHSHCTTYNSVDASPCHRDFIAELSHACQAEGIPFCLYYSQAQDWHDPDGYRAYHNNEGKNFRRYLDEKCLPQLRELLTGYGSIHMIWFDTPMGMTETECREVFECVKAIQPNCLISGRIGCGLGEYLTTQDNRIPAFPIQSDWELPGTTNRSWGFIQSDQDWASPETIIRKLVKIISRGGNYLLNVGPDGQGKIPDKCGKNLDAVGAFLRANGEAYYGTQATPPYPYETADIYFSHRPNHLYLTIFEPERFISTPLPLPNIGNRPIKARVLDGNIEFRVDCRHTLEGDGYWGITLPECIRGKLAAVIDVETEEQDVCFEPIDKD